jgi:hypothetical protein
MVGCFKRNAIVNRGLHTVQYYLNFFVIVNRCLRIR